MRRDRWWERRPLLDGSDLFILEGPITRTVKYSYTSGSSLEETEEFGRSITVEPNLGPLDFLGEVSFELSQTFSTTVTVHEEESLEVEEEFGGEPGIARVMTLWVLVDRYTFTDAAGNPYTDPSYEIVSVELIDQGRIVALLATDFEL